MRYADANGTQLPVNLRITTQSDTVYDSELFSLRGVATLLNTLQSLR